MSLLDLDHVNIRTANLAELRDFYAAVLGLEIGPRPPFSFEGAWLYCGHRAAVHLRGVDQTPDGGDPRLEHFAFRAEGLAAFLEKLRGLKVPYRISRVPKLDLRQVNIHDPDGNHIEIAFAAEEDADLSEYRGN